MALANHVKTFGLIGGGVLLVGLAWYLSREKNTDPPLPPAVGEIIKNGKQNDIPELEKYIAPGAASYAEATPWVVSQIASQGGEQARQVLIKALESPRPEVRVAVAVELPRIIKFRFAEPQVVSALAEAAQKDEAADVRAAAARSLGSAGMFEGVEPLLVAMDDSELMVRRCAFAALERILGVSFGYRATDPPAQRKAMIEHIRNLMPRLKLGHDAGMQRLLRKRQEQQTQPKK